MIDLNLVEDVIVGGIDYADYPKFCDAYIESATYEGKEMSEEMLDELNDDMDFVHGKVVEFIF